MCIMDMSDIVKQLEKEKKELLDICIQLVLLTDSNQKATNKVDFDTGIAIGSWSRASNIAEQARNVLTKQRVVIEGTPKNGE